MRSRFLLGALLVCMGTSSFAQLKVESNGYINSSNQTIDGCMGKNGVFTVKSSRTEPGFNSFLHGSPSLIRAVCTGFPNVLAFSTLNGINNNVFYVKGDGEIFTSKGLLQPGAKIAQTRSARSTSLTSSLSKLKSINATVYHPSEFEEQSRARNASLTDEEIITEAPELSPIEQQMALEDKIGRFGLLTEEVEKAFPEVVRTLPDGSKGIMYTDLVPVLIESIKELQAELNQIKAMVAGEVPQLAPQQQGATSASNTIAQTDAELFQNTPNPFNQTTKIAYRLPQGLTAASICIYNLNGQQLKKYPLQTDSANSTVTISASELAPGMYIYALVIDNQVVDSKRMTLTD